MGVDLMVMSLSRWPQQIQVNQHRLLCVQLPPLDSMQIQQQSDQTRHDQVEETSPTLASMPGRSRGLSGGVPIPGLNCLPGQVDQHWAQCPEVHHGRMQGRHYLLVKGKQCG